mgnify:FL=1
MLGFMHKVAYMLLMVDYGCYVDGERLKRLKGTDSTADNVVMHIAEASSNLSLQAGMLFPDEHLVILTMIGGVVSHDQMEKLLQVVFAITEYTVCNYGVYL